MYNGRQAVGPSIYEIDIWRIVPCQINDVIYLVHPDYPVYKLERFADTDWRLSQVAFLTPALIDQNATGVLITPGALIGTTTLTASASAWAGAVYYLIGQSVSSGGSLYTCVMEHTSSVFATDLANGKWRLETIFTSGNVGGFFQLGYIRNAANVQLTLAANGTSAVLEASGECEFTTYGSWAATVDLERSDDYGATWYKIRTISSLSDHNGNIAIKIAGVAQFRMVVTNYTASVGAPRAVFNVISSVAYGLAKVTVYTSAVLVTVDVLSRFYASSATQFWSEGAWSNRRGFPQAVTAFQQRFIYGGSSHEPQRIWGTQTNDIENFALGDQTLASDGLAFDLAAVGRGRIQWLIGQVDLFVGFSGAEWIVNAGAGAYGGSNDPITAQAINAGEQSSWGSAEGVPPALVGNNVLYTQRAGRTLQAITFSVYTNKYQSADLTSLSEHLFGAGIRQIAYQPQFRSQSIIWVVSESGALCGMTYDSQSEVYAWHRHISAFAENGSNPSSINFIESVACIDGQGDDDDEVWVVVDRPNGRMIELINPINWETAADPVKGIKQPSMSLAIYVDSAITVLAPGSNVISGLTHLNGMDVIGLLNGNMTFGPLTVIGGQITIADYVAAASDIIHVGLPIHYEVQGMRMDNGGNSGLLIGVTKAISRVYLRLFNSLSGKVVGNGLKEIPIQYRTQALPLNVGPALFTGQKEVVPEGTQSDDPTLIIQGSDPLPLTILATTMRVGISGSA